MKVTYIYHSGFLVETAECYYLFDHYRGDLPALNPQKPVLVFASHFHQDHYNPAVFSRLRDMGMSRVSAILANDISKNKYPEGWLLLDTAGPFADMSSFDHHILRVCHSREYELPFQTHVKTLLSTDSGVAFLLTCPEGTFYHAGDLNDWVNDETPEKERRQMTGSFRASLRPLQGISIDYACLPLDPRLGSHYADGFLYFLEKIGAKKVCPMHYWNRPDIISQFLGEHPEYSATILAPTAPGTP